MNSPLALPKFSTEYVAQRNHVFRRRVALPARWLGREWVWTLQPLAASSWSGAWAEAEWGDARAWVTLPSSLLRELAGGMLRTGQIIDLPPALRLALAETAFAALSERVESLSRRPLRLLALDAMAPQLLGMEGLGWQMHSKRDTHAGELWLSPDGIGLLAAAFQRLASPQALRLDLSKLPVRFRFCAGWTSVKMTALARLAVRDVILFDESWLSRDGGITVSVGRNAAFRGVIRGAMIEVTDGLVPIMEDVFDDDHQESDDPLDDLPVRVSFDLGERSMPLHELRSLAAGFIFDLGRELRQAVHIRANGMLIGEGELVDIEGRIGVVVTTLLPAAEKPA
jgi:type III secretion protein Q